MPDVLRQQLQEILGAAYNLERELGGGGMSRVFVASDVELDRKVVVKVLPPELAAGVNTERFRREIQLAARLQHPHIVPLLSAGARGALLFYTMPFIEGESLRAKLSRSRELSISEATRVLREVADALRYAHGQGVVHRDIKPENILLSQHHAQVTDFGVSKALSNAAAEQASGSSDSITSVGIALGTPAYMAPEQAAADPLVDHRADIYALGVVGYELLTGRTPFGGRTPQQLLSAQITAIPDEVTRHRPHVPPQLARIIMRCLEKNPADRFQSAEELHTELEQAATPSASTPVPGFYPRAIAPLARSSATKRVGLLAAVAAIIVAATVFATAAYRGDATEWEIGGTRGITNSPGIEIHPDVSPDGKMVAYVATTTGRPKVHIRQMSGGRAIVLGDSLEPGQFPDWSPDGSTIAYSNRNGISVVPALGGSSRILVPASDSTRYTQPEWSPDGKRIAAVMNPDGVIVVIDLKDGSPGEVMRAGEPGSHSPAWSPDGRLIAYTSGNWAFTGAGPNLGNIAPSKILIVAAEGGASVPLTDQLALNMSPVFSHDGEHVFFVSSRGGGRDIYSQKIDRAGKPEGAPSRLTTGINAHGISLASNGRTLVYSSLRTTSNISSIAIRGSKTSTAPLMRPVTTGQQTIENVGISPDNRWLVYDSDLSGQQDIYKVRREGGEPVRLTNDSADDFNPAWSPDGKEIAYHTFAKGTRDIFVMSSDGTGHKPVVSTPLDERSPRWSPDGNAIVYNETGHLYIVRRSSRSASWGTSSKLRQGANATWSPDGNSISFVQEGKLMLLPLRGGTAVPITDGTPAATQGSPVWSPDGKTIYFVGRSAAARQVGIWAAPVAGGQPVLAAAFTDPDRPLYREAFAMDSTHFYITVGIREADIGALELTKR